MSNNNLYLILFTNLICNLFRVKLNIWLFSDYYRYSSGPPNYGYNPGSYGGSSGSGGYPPTDIAPGHFRGRGYLGDSYSGDWRSNKDYRRDYDRRPPPPNANS